MIPFIPKSRKIYSCTVNWLYEIFKERDAEVVKLTDQKRSTISALSEGMIDRLLLFAHGSPEGKISFLDSSEYLLDWRKISEIPYNSAIIMMCYGVSVANHSDVDFKNTFVFTFEGKVKYRKHVSEHIQNFHFHFHNKFINVLELKDSEKRNIEDIFTEILRLKKWAINESHRVESLEDEIGKFIIEFFSKLVVIYKSQKRYWDNIELDLMEKLRS